ncbi:MAG: hypothetical protein WA634_02470 [Silvibacterium sp.]
MKQKGQGLDSAVQTEPDLHARIGDIHQLREPQRVEVVGQVREIAVPWAIGSWIVAAGQEQELTRGNDLAQDLMVQLGDAETSVAVEVYFGKGTDWGSGFPLPAAGLYLKNYIGPLYARVSPTAANSGDIRMLQTRAVARPLQTRPIVQQL